MYRLGQIFGGLLVCTGVLLLSVVSWLAAKGLKLDVPLDGRYEVVPIWIGLPISFAILIVGAMTFVVARRHTGRHQPSHYTRKMR